MTELTEFDQIDNLVQYNDKKTLNEEEILCVNKNQTCIISMPQENEKLAQYTITLFFLHLNL